MSASFRSRRSHRTPALLALAAAGALAAAPARAELSAEADLRLELSSAYVWRGQVLTDRGVLFPQLTVGTSTGIWIDAWGALDLSDENGSDYEGQFEEVDLTLGYSFEAGETLPVSVDLGLIQYLFPVDGEPTREVFGSLAVPVALGDRFHLTPHGSIYWDVDATGGDGVYGVAGLSFEASVTQSLRAKAGATVGVANGAYHRNYFDLDPGSAPDPDTMAALERLERAIDGMKVEDLRLSVDLVYQVAPAVALGVGGAYGWLPDDDLAEAAALLFDDDEQWWGGVSVSVHLD